MLGPFRIRNLRRPLLPSHPSSAKIRSYDAVVSLTGQEYDRNVYRHPESKLKYLDQDDGEVITVCRLPVLRSFLCLPNFSPQRGLRWPEL